MTTQKNNAFSCLDDPHCKRVQRIFGDKISESTNYLVSPFS